MRKALSQLLLLLPLLSVFSCRQGADTLHTADDYFRQGQALHREHYLLRAADCYRQAACLAGRDSMLHARISLELGRINRFKLQRIAEDSCLDNALRIARGLQDSVLLAEVRHEKARTLIARGKHGTAKTLLQRALLQRPEARKDLARLLLAERQADSALAVLSPEAASPACRLLRAEAFLMLDRYDSARYYLEKDYAQFSLRERVQACRDLARLEEATGHPGRALAEMKRHADLRDSLDADHREELQEKISSSDEYRLQRERAERAERERDAGQVMFYRVLSAALALIGLLLALFIRNKRREAHLERRLRQQELEATQRKLEYYRSLNAITIPILCGRRNEPGALHLGDEDWETVTRNTDACFDRFTERLRAHCPLLTEEDVRFCCLVKMELPLAVLADIYHIAKGSISRRKMRLKEKLGVTDSSFDEFIAGF